MLQTIYADADVGMGSLFGRPSAALQKNLQAGVQNFIAHTQGFANDIAERVQARYNDFTTGEFSRRINQVRGMVQQHFQEDSGIYRVETIEDFQHIGDGMRAYVMAHPDLKQMKADNRINGYEGLYIDPSPTLSHGTSFEYRTITNGIVMEQENDDGDSVLVSRSNYEAIKPEYNPTFSEKVAVAQTYTNITHYLNDSLLDITSEDNELMG